MVANNLLFYTYFPLFLLALLTRIDNFLLLFCLKERESAESRVEVLKLNLLSVAYFWIPIKAYWQSRSKENEAAMRKSLIIDTTKWQHTHSVTNIETISSDDGLIDQPLLDRPRSNNIKL